MKTPLPRGFASVSAAPINSDIIPEAVPPHWSFDGEADKRMRQRNRISQKLRELLELLEE